MELMQVFLPTIVVQPIGYDDAKEILQQMGGLSAPEDWQESKTKPNLKKLKTTFITSWKMVGEFIKNMLIPWGKNLMFGLCFEVIYYRARSQT
jgi:hypothetical protein